jgi:DNA modification methylase
MVSHIEFGDCRATLRRWASEGVKTQMCVTSPPYLGLRDYGHEGQIGLEQTPDEYIAAMVEVFRCVRDVLADDGTLWLNIGDSYAGGGGGNYSKSVKQTSHGEHITNVRNRPDWLASTGLKPKDLIGIPWMLAFALRADGWYLRQDIIWHKPNPMPESVRDRCTKAHEYVFLLSKSERYFFDSEAIKEPAVGGLAGNTKPTKAGRAYEAGAAEHRTSAGLHKWADRQRSRRDSFKRDDSKRAEVIPGQTVGTHRPDRPESDYDIEKRNRRSVWTVATRPYKGAHFATFPPALIEPCILAGSRPGDIVLDPFMGSGTTAQVALQHGRQYLGCELNLEYQPLQNQRINQPAQLVLFAA